MKSILSTYVELGYGVSNQNLYLQQCKSGFYFLIVDFTIDAIQSYRIL